MAGLQGIIVALVVILTTGSLGGKWVAAQVHHVVGGDRGWDTTSDLSSWSSRRVFRVGDQIWFTHSVAQGLIAEVKSREEYESCDLSNPIRMYTDGLHAIPLEQKGIRYFVSSEPQNCKIGLKLHVEVLPTTNSSAFNSTSPRLEAEGPSTTSGSVRYGDNPILMLIVMFCVAAGVAYCGNHI